MTVKIVNVKESELVKSLHWLKSITENLELEKVKFSFLDKEFTKECYSIQSNPMVAEVVRVLADASIDMQTKDFKTYFHPLTFTSFSKAEDKIFFQTSNQFADEEIFEGCDLDLEKLYEYYNIIGTAEKVTKDGYFVNSDGVKKIFPKEIYINNPALNITIEEKESI